MLHKQDTGILTYIRRVFTRLDCLELNSRSPALEQPGVVGQLVTAMCGITSPANSLQDQVHAILLTGFGVIIQRAMTQQHCQHQVHNLSLCHQRVVLSFRDFCEAICDSRPEDATNHKALKLPTDSIVHKVATLLWTSEIMVNRNVNSQLADVLPECGIQLQYAALAITSASLCSRPLMSLENAPPQLGQLLYQYAREATESTSAIMASSSTDSADAACAVKAYTLSVEVCALSSLSNDEEVRLTLDALQAELEIPNLALVQLKAILSTIGKLGVQHNDCQSIALHVFAGYLTNPTDLVHSHSPTGVSGSASAAAVGDLIAVCVQGMLAIAWNASTPECIAECLQSLSTAAVLARHNPSVVANLVRQNVIQTLGALSTRMLSHGVDFVDAVVVILGQQLFKPPSQLDGLIIEQLVGVATVGPDSIFQAFSKQLVQITSQLLEYMAIECTKDVSSSPPTNQLPQRNLTMQQGGSDPLDSDAFKNTDTLSSVNVGQLRKAIPTSVAALVSKGTRRPVVLLAELFDQFLFMFVTFAIRAFALGEQHALLWATPFEELAPIILGPIARAIRNQLPELDNGRMWGTDLLPCFWGIAAMLSSQSNDATTTTNGLGPWDDLVACSEALTTQLPGQCLARLPQLVPGSAVLNRMTAMSHNTLLLSFIECDSQAQSRIKYLDAATGIHYSGVVALERRRVQAKDSEFLGTITYVAHMHTHTPAPDQILLQSIADTVFRIYLDSEKLRDDGALQEGRLERLAVQLLEYSNDGRDLLKQCADRYLVQLLSQYSFLFCSQRVIVSMLDLLQLLAAHAKKGGISCSLTTPNGAILPSNTEHFGETVGMFSRKCREFVEQALSFASAKASSVLQSYTASLAFDFTTTVHAGVELAMQCLTRAGGKEQPGYLGSFGANVAQQSRFLAEVTALAEERARLAGPAADNFQPTLQVLGDEFVESIRNNIAAFSQLSRAKPASKKEDMVPNCCTVLVRLTALSVLKEDCCALWIRVIFGQPILAGNDVFLKTGLFAWRWLLCKRPELTTRALGEISCALTTLYTKFPAVSRCPASSESSVRLCGDLYTFITSLFSTANKLRQEHIHLYRKITLDTVNVVHKHGVYIPANARYSALGLCLDVLQSSAIPQGIDERIKRGRVYDSILLSFTSRKQCPHIQTLFGDISAMACMWKLMVLDKPFCKQLDSICSDESQHLTWKRNLSLVLVHHELLRHIAWYNPRELHNLHLAHEDEVRRMARPNPNPSDNTWLEYLRLTWALDPCLSVYIVAHMFGPQLTMTSLVAKSLAQLVREHPDEVAHIPTAINFALEDQADVKIVMSWPTIPVLQALLLVHRHGTNLAVLRYAAALIEGADTAQHIYLVPQLVQLLRLDHPSKIWESLLYRLATKSLFLATHLLWNLNCQKDWDESQDIAQRIADSIPQEMQRVLHRDLETVDELLLLSYRIETDRAMKNINNDAMFEQVRHTADKLQGCETLLGHGEHILAAQPSCNTSFNGIFDISVRIPNGETKLPSEAQRRCQFKHSVDLRREMLINQMVHSLNQGFDEAGLNLIVYTRHVIAMKHTGGCVEVPPADAMSQIGRHSSIMACLKEQAGPSMAPSQVLVQKIERCIHSMAGIAIVIYLLQCSPPELEMLAVSDVGNLHIDDFGQLNKNLSGEMDFKKAMKSIFDLLGDESGLSFWGMYTDLCIQGFLAARYYQDQFVGLATIMMQKDDTSKHFASRIVHGIHARLLPGKTDSEAANFIRTKFVS